MHWDRLLILEKRDPGCSIIQKSLRLNKLSRYMCFSWPVHSFLQYFISERMRCSCLLCLSSLICRWKEFSDYSDSLLTAKFTRSKSSSSLIVGFFNSGRRSFLTFPFLMPVYRRCKNRIFKKFASYRQSSLLTSTFCVKDISLPKKSILCACWVYEALQCSVKVDVESFSL